MTLPPNARTAIVAALAAGIFVFSFLLRFNDPGGSFAGLTDDHFFYLVRGWQILFGDLPVRDFVDHGAPLYYYLGAAVQQVLGRGTVSEVEFSAVMLALAAALTFWVCERATGSIVLGIAGAALQLLLEPRFYNYPKLLAYAAALPLLWRFADKPGDRSVLWVAIATMVAFLFRHDHGVFIGLSMAVLLLLMTDVPWKERLRHAVAYGALVVVLLAPYLIFIQRNGGVDLVLPAGVGMGRARPQSRSGASGPVCSTTRMACPPPPRPAAPVRVVAVVRDNWVAWMYYAEIALPLVALFVLLASRDASARMAAGTREDRDGRRARARARRRIPAQPARGAPGRSVGAACHPLRVAAAGDSAAARVAGIAFGLGRAPGLARRAAAALASVAC